MENTNLTGFSITIETARRSTDAFRVTFKMTGKRQYFYGRTYESVVEKIKKILTRGTQHQT